MDVRKLQEKVVVVTGASSGIGRATAVESATHGARVVVAARRGEALDEVVRLCADAGGEALAVVTDVSREESVNALVRAALTRWGRIDVWVNNAGVTLFAPLEDGPIEEHRRVIETNLFGPMYAARAVVPIFRGQGAGVMINVGSVLSQVGQPFVPSYAISKFALRGLSEALRTELADAPDIHVCTVFPYAVDTPHFESGANRIGRKAYTMPPVQSPEKVARAIVDVAAHPRAERYVPRIAPLGLALHRMLPRPIERLLLHALRAWHLGGAQIATQGNLFEPSRDPATVHGTRPPRVGTAHFFAWAALEFAKIQTQEALRALGRSLGARRPLGAH